MNKEYFDLLDENGNKIGKRKLRSEVRRDGDWHKAVHIWIINNNGEIPAQPVVTEDDVKFYNRGDGTVTFRLWSSVPKGMSQINFTALSTPPLTDIDYANGTFTKASGYENCGATR